MSITLSLKPGAKCTSACGYCWGVQAAIPTTAIPIKSESTAVLVGSIQMLE